MTPEETTKFMFFSKWHFRKVKPCFPNLISSCQGLGLGLTKKLHKWPPVLYLDCGSSYKTAYACQQRRTWQPTPYSCLENPADRGAWWAAVHGVAQSQTQLKRLSMHACMLVKLFSWNGWIIFCIHCTLIKLKLKTSLEKNIPTF